MKKINLKNILKKTFKSKKVKKKNKVKIIKKKVSKKIVGITGANGALGTAFIKKYPTHLKHEGARQPGKVYPYPASWHRLDSSLRFASMEPEKFAGSKPPDLMFSMASGFVGEATAVAFVDFVKNHEHKFSAEDVLNDYQKKRE